MIPLEHLDPELLFEMEVGQSKSFNHSSCPAGPDHRGRLSVLRKAANLWLVYCYNCGEGNALRMKGGAGVSTEWTKSVLDMLTEHLAPDEPIIPDEMVGTTRGNSLPVDITYNTIEWDSWAHERLWKFHTNAGKVRNAPYGWGFLPSRNQLITPIVGVEGLLYGYQARQAPDTKPKCITTYFEGHKGKPLFYRGASNILFIVEDPLSALRIHLCCGHHALSLLGTHLSDTALVDLLNIIKAHAIERVMIWFDDDTAGKEASHKVFYRLAKLLRDPVKVSTHTYLEPKQIIDLKGHVDAWTSRS